MSEFVQRPLFDDGPAGTEYRLLADVPLSASVFAGRPILIVPPEAKPPASAAERPVGAFHRMGTALLIGRHGPSGGQVVVRRPPIIR